MQIALSSVSKQLHFQIITAPDTEYAESSNSRAYAVFLSVRVVNN